MRLTPRHRHRHADRKVRIAITEAEISADLHYPAPPQAQRPPALARGTEPR
ncbi:MAG TPA: hypothetical protein VF731_07685 [Solirubrobacterales bacterium]